MDKEQVLEHLRNAKTAHIKWVQKAKLLINGIEVKKDAIPVDSTECKFGRWFYSDGQVLNALSELKELLLLNRFYLQISKLFQPK